MNHLLLLLGVATLLVSVAATPATVPTTDPATDETTAPTTKPTTMPDKPGIANQTSNAVVLSEFIFKSAPFPSCHASTIAQTLGGAKAGLVAAFFGGTRERAPDVGIWVSRNNGANGGANGDSGWSPLIEVADGVQPDGTRLPCWNPVLFQSKQGPLLLFYKIGPSPALWWGMLRTSTDDGATWSAASRLPGDIIGPAKDKPIALADGSILCPTGTENHGTRIRFERTEDLGKTWTATDYLTDGKSLTMLQPTLLDHGNGVLQYLCRTKSQKIYQGWSTDNGKTWDTPAPTDLPNPNSGIDAVQLKDGRSLVVYNDSPTARTPLNVAISADGKSWKQVLTLENGEPQYSYPAVIQTADGMVHITYTWKRKRIAHIVVDPSKLD